jgi:hypothetical protein
LQRIGGSVVNDFQTALADALNVLTGTSGPASVGRSVGEVGAVAGVNLDKLLKV